MDHKTNQEMNILSKEVYGTSSKWQKLMRKGVKQVWERDREVVVPTANGQFRTKVFKDQKYTVKYYTFEEVKEEMLKILEERKKNREALAAAPVQSVLTPNESPFPPYPGQTMQFSNRSGALTEEVIRSAAERELLGNNE